MVVYRQKLVNKIRKKSSLGGILNISAKL